MKIHATASILVIVFAMGVGFTNAQDLEAGSNDQSKFTRPTEIKPRTPVESLLEQAVENLRHREYKKALEIVHSLYGREDADQALILKAESAICAVQAANRLDSKRGHWGREPDWRSAHKPDFGWIGEQPNYISIEYFDMIVGHSLRRLEWVAANGGKKEKDEKP